MRVRRGLPFSSVLGVAAASCKRLLGGSAPGGNPNGGNMVTKLCWGEGINKYASQVNNSVYIGGLRVEYANGCQQQVMPGSCRAVRVAPAAAVPARHAVHVRL